MNGLEVADPYVERLIEGVGVSGGARAAEARRRVSAVHAGAARDRLSALPGADAVDARRAAAARQERSGPRERHAHRAARHARCSRSPARTTRRRASSGPRRTSRCCRSRSSSANYFSFAPDLPLNTLPIASADQGRPPDSPEDDGRPEIRADVDRSPVASIWPGATTSANKLLEICLATGLGVLVRPVGGRRAGRHAAAGRRLFGRSVSTTTKRCCRSACDRSRATACCRSISRFRSGYRFVELAGLAPSLERVDGGRGRARGALRPRRRDARERRRCVEPRSCSARRP